MTEAKGLRKQFGDDAAVDGATFNINPSDVVGFLGPNGAGKTTTIKMITGLPAPDEGQALITCLALLAGITRFFVQWSSARGKKA